MEKLYCVLGKESKETLTYLYESNLNLADELYEEGSYDLIEIEEELRKILCEKGTCILKSDIDVDKIYTKEDIQYFEITNENIFESPPDTIKFLGEELTQEKLKNIQKDSTISKLGEELANVKLQLIQIQGGV